MKTLRKTPKVDILLNMFDEVGKKVLVEKVLEETSIKSYNSLRSLLSYMRLAPHIGKENRVDIRLDHGYCVRVK